MAIKFNANPNQPTVKVNGKEYVRIGDKLVEPGAVCTSEEVRHPDGRVDCTVHVPCLQIAAKQVLPT